MQTEWEKIKDPSLIGDPSCHDESDYLGRLRGRSWLLSWESGQKLEDTSKIFRPHYA